MSDPIFEATEMDGVAPLEQAKKAIAHALRVIRDNPQVGWHMGAGTQSFALLTEAYATIAGGRSVREVREAYAPRAGGPSDSELVTQVRVALQDWIVMDRVDPSIAGQELGRKLKHIFRQVI